MKIVGINPVSFHPDFYILLARFCIFRTNWNWYEIQDVKFENGTETIWLVSRSFPHLPYFIGIPIFTNSIYIVFTIMCVAMAINLLNLLSECGVVSSDYILHYYVWL